MKRIISFILIITTILCLSSCCEQPSNPYGSPKNTFVEDLTKALEESNKAIELVNAWFDGKTIVMKDPTHGVENWTSIRHPDYWSYLGKFCDNVDKYKII